MKNQVDHPEHYGGKDNPYEAIKVIEAWELSFCLGNTVKYVSRAGKKDPNATIQDLEKARWYLDREIQNNLKVPEASVRVFSKPSGEMIKGNWREHNSAEKAILKSMREVEDLGADELLTDAVIFLQKAQDCIKAYRNKIENK